VRFSASSPGALIPPDSSREVYSLSSIRAKFYVRYAAPLPDSGDCLNQPANGIALAVAKQLKIRCENRQKLTRCWFTIVSSREGANKRSLYVKLKNDRATSTAKLQDQIKMAPI
jgi:hypothetical protein